MYQKLSQEERIKARFVPSGYTEYRRVGNSVIYASEDHRSAIAYRGNAARSEWFYRFTSENSFLSTVTRFFQSIAEHEDRKEQRKKEKRDFITALKPGDILVTSWGYEQTNVDFYQVIEVTGKQTIVIREIQGTVTENGCYMQGSVMPRPNEWARDSLLIKKRVQVFGGNEYVSMTGYSSAHKWDGKPMFCSWYG
jgi:hypothetical protein